MPCMKKWRKKSAKIFVSSKHPTMGQFKKLLCRDIIHDFDNQPITDEKNLRRHCRRNSGKIPAGCQQSSGRPAGTEGLEAVMPDSIDFCSTVSTTRTLKQKILA